MIDFYFFIFLGLVKKVMNFMSLMMKVMKKWWILTFFTKVNRKDLFGRQKMS